MRASSRGTPGAQRNGELRDAAALREALFSTAVQHGASGAARIFNEAIDKFLNRPEAGQVGGAKSFEQALVSEVYNKRQHQFGGSTEAVRQSVQGRLRQEKDMVLAMLDKKGVTDPDPKAFADFASGIATSLRNHDGKTVVGTGHHPVKWSLI